MHIYDMDRIERERESKTQSACTTVCLAVHMPFVFQNEIGGDGGWATVVVVVYLYVWNVWKIEQNYSVIIQHISIE